MLINQETIKRFIEEAHGNAVERGFYDCPVCLDEYGEPTGCSSCKGTAIDQNKNIGELLMLIVSELGEALEAHRCKRFAPFFYYEGEIDQEWFESHIKDTFEDEIADVFIRLFDLAGYLGIELDEYSVPLDSRSFENIGHFFMIIIGKLYFIFDAMNTLTTNNYEEFYSENYISQIIGFLIQFCQHHNIPIQKHIEAKMAYNRTRHQKHGKAY